MLSTPGAWERVHPVQSTPSAHANGPVDDDGGLSADGLDDDVHVDGVRPRKPRALKVEMAAAWDGCDGASISGTMRHRIGACEPLLRRLADGQGVEPLALWCTAMARFRADPDVQRKRLGLPVFLSQLAEWCAMPKGNGRGPAPVSTEFDESQNPDWAMGGSHG